MIALKCVYIDIFKYNLYVYYINDYTNIIWN